MRLTTMILMGVAASFTASASAQSLISFGDNGLIELQADTAGQQVQFHITGDTAFDGLELNLQIGDGGSVLGGTDVGPIITDIDMLTGTIFQGHNPTPWPVEVHDRVRQHTVDMTSLVEGPGLIATVTFSTEGVEEGDYAFLLKGIAAMLDTQLFNGVNVVPVEVPAESMIRVVPEPTTALLLMVLTGSVVGMRTRRRA